MRRTRLGLVVVGIALGACGGGTTSDSDSGTPADAQAVDATGGGVDSGSDAGGAACTAIAPRAVSDATTALAAPRIAATGTGFGVLWPDSRDGAGTGMGGEAYFAQLDASGARVGSDVRVTNAAASVGGVDIAWNGSAHGVVLGEMGGTYFTRLDSAGAPAFAEVSVGMFSAPPWIAASSATFGIVSTDPTTVELVLQTDASPGTTVPVGMGINPTIASTAGGWAIAFHTTERVWLALLDAGGTRAGADHMVSDGPGVRADVAAGPGGVGVAWLDRLTMGRDVFFARLDESGARIGAQVQLTMDALDQSMPVVAAGRGGYAVAWLTSDGDVVAVFVDASGTVSAPTTIAGGAFFGVFRPLDIVADGERFAIVWLAGGVAGNQPYFATYCP